LTGIFFVIAGAYIKSSTEDFFSQELKTNASAITPYILAYAENKNYRDLNLLVKSISARVNNRITVIEPDGTVAADSQSDASLMPNHYDRDEVRSVIEGSPFCVSLRHSPTLNENTLYAAVPLTSNGALQAVLRLSMPIKTVNLFTRKTFKSIFIVFAWFFLISIAAAYFISKKMTSGIALLNKAALNISEGNFNEKILIRSDDEIETLADSFNKMSDDVKQLETLKKDFIINASHELKTPLTSIIGFAETIETGQLPPETAHYLSIIKKQAQRLSNIVNDLLSLSLLETVKKIDKQNVDIIKIISDCVSLYKKKTEEKGIVIITDVAKDLKPAYANEFNIEQLFINLIDNAVKYTEKGRIEIKAANYDACFIKISVADTGIGIAKEHLARIFERFYVADKSRSKQTGGTGLGLSIVRHILNVNGGSISVESVEKKGAVFTVTLPAAAD
jgi:signal transduction histidine kinase